MIARTGIERMAAQAGTDDAGTPGLWRLLFAVLGPPTSWSAHFLVSYIYLAYACNVRTGAARPVLTLISLVALALTAWSGWLAWRQWRVARAADRPVDDAWDARMGERTARVSFLMVVGLIGAAVFSVGIVYEAIAVWLVPLCEPGVVV